MQKVLLIAILITVFIYLISRKIIKKGQSNAILKSNKQGFYLLQAENRLLGRTIKNTMLSASLGLGLFLIVVFLAMKIKILLFLIPVSIYLMGQMLLLNNQLKYIKDQQIWYQPRSHTVLVEWLDGKGYHFNLLKDIQRVKCVRAIQKNNHIMFGYYQLELEAGSLYLPLLLAESGANSTFFDDLAEHYGIQTKTTMFPMI